MACSSASSKVDNNYAGSEIQKIAYPSLAASVIYSHTGAYANGASWFDWILPVGGKIVSANAAHGVSVTLQRLHADRPPSGAARSPLIVGPVQSRSNRRSRWFDPVRRGFTRRKDAYSWRMEPPKPEKPERNETDESLRRERDKTDDEVHRRNEREAGIADAAIDQARDNADEVVRATRETHQPRPDQAQASVRGEEDAAIQRQRATADVQLDDLRRERTRALAALFALERDLTDQHLLAERTRADVALNNRDDFLAMVAHDLRAYMAEIALRAAWLTAVPGEDEAGKRARRIGQGIQRSTAGMKRLVSDLLDVAAIEAGKLSVEVEVGDVARVLRDAAEPFRSAAEAKGIALNLEEIPDSVSGVFDHDRLIQVLGNLVSNAIKFTPSGGRISLRLAVVADEVRIAVADTGTGITADKLEEIFQRFTQLRTDRRGLGLGLYISKCVIEAQHGRIWATSVLGKSSTFSFSLPLAR